MLGAVLLCLSWCLQTAVKGTLEMAPVMAQADM